MSHHRRTVRHPCRIAVRIVDGGRPQPALTGDVSDHGLFVRTDESWVPNALVRLHVVDPEDPRPLALLGIVARCIPRSAVPTEPPEGPGIGVSLFGNGLQAETLWRALVRRAAAASAGWRASLAAAETALDAVRRHHTRRSALLMTEVELEGQRVRGDLDDVSEGGALIRLGASMPLETTTRLHFTARGADAVALHARAVRLVASTGALDRGIAFRIAPRSEAETTQWVEFLARHAPVRRALPAFLPSFEPSLLSANQKEEPPA